MIEIGLGSPDAPSSKLWLDLFKNAYIYGIDILLNYTITDRFKPLQCDQSNMNDLLLIKDQLHGKNIFFINDDGSHIPEHQLLTFNILFPLLQNGGVYIIEDIETSYWIHGNCYNYDTNYGYKNNRSIIEIFKDTIDNINSEFIYDKNVLSTKVWHKNYIESITFARNCIIIKKNFTEERDYRLKHYITPRNIFDNIVLKNNTEFKNNTKLINTKKEVGFIVLRHVNSDLTNKYWINCIKSIRKYYPENNIIIIDDNSNYDYITNEPLYKTTIIDSEYPKRGELLPYYYYLHNKLFDIAVIIHDSIVINKYIDFTVEKYKFLWDFQSNIKGCDYLVDDEIRMINILNDFELKAFYEKKDLWRGCFGGMAIITHDYLTFINNKYDIKKLLDYVISRYYRGIFERVIGCLLQKEDITEALFGDIINYCPFGSISYDQIDYYKHLPIIKFWCGR